MKITTFDRSTCRDVSERIAKALAPLAQELGVSITPRGGSYGPGHYTLKVEVATIATDGKVRTKQSEDFQTLAKLYGMSPNDLGRTFRSGGKEYTIAGLAPRKRARPIIASCGGREYCFAAEDVKRLMVVTP